MKKLLLKTMLLLCALVAGTSMSWAADVTDVLNNATTGVTGTSYSTWSGKTSTSSAVYAGNSAGGNSSIQLRSNNNNSGVVTTASGGKVKSITVTWNSNTSSGRTLNVYGKNSAYSAATDLYNTSNQGTLIGTIVCGTSTELIITGDYKYVGFRSASGAMYLDKVEIVWETSTGGGDALPNVATIGNDLTPTSVNVGDLNDFSLTITPADGLTASDYTVAWASSDDSKLELADETYEALAAGSVTVTVTVTPDDDTQYNEVSKQFTVTVVDPNAKGTETNPYTVAEARAAIDAGTGVTGVYAKGTVSEIVDAYNSQYGNISYNISADGLTTSDQLQAYRGKGKNANNFTSADDIQVGDVVVVSGNLTKYNSTYEFASGNQLAKIVRKPSFSPAAGAVTSGETVTLSSVTGATIYYTTDGTEPTTSSATYSTPIEITATTTIKAFAVNDGLTSETVTAAYTITSAVATTTTIDDSGITNTDVYVGTAAGSLSATVTPDGGAALSTPTITWSGDNDAVATINESTGVVTLVGAGTVTFTATYAGVANTYLPSSNTYELTVTSSAPYVQPTEFDIALNNSLFGTSYTGTASGITDDNPESGSQDNVTVTYAGSGNHYINDSQIRFYPSNKLTFEAPSGYNITKIVFTSAGTWAATIAADGGTYTSDTKTWTGEAISVVFTGSGSSRCDMSKATITLAANSAVATTTTIDDSDITNTDVYVSTTAGSFAATVKDNVDATIDAAAVTWSSSNTSVATIDSSTGAVTLVAAGSTTITASYAGVTGTYQPSSDTYELTVTNSNPSLPGSKNNPYTVAQVEGQAEATTFGNDIYVTGYIVGSVKNNKCYKNTSDLVDTNLLLADTPDVSFTEGANVASNSDGLIPVELPSGDIRNNWGVASNNVIGYKVILKGNAQSYFSTNAIKGTSEISAVSVPASIGSNGYATFASPFALDLTTTASLKAYKAAVSGTTVTFTELNQTVPANTGILLEGEATVNIPVVASGDEVTGNDFLVNSTGATFTGDDNYYYFGLVKNTLTFGLFAPNEVAIPANKAYLKVLKSSIDAAGARELNVVFEDATGIESIHNSKSEIQNAVFDLSGRRVSKAQKGIYIVNGKKVVK